MKNVVNRNTEIRTYNYDLQNVFNTLIKTLNLTMLITFPSALTWIPAQVRFWKVSSSSNQTSLTPNIKASSNLHPITTTSPHFFSTPLHFLSIPKKIIAPTKNPFSHSSTKHTRLKPNQSPPQSHYTPPFSINTPTQKKGVIIPSPPPHGIRPIIARINRCLNFPRRLQLLHMLTLRTSPWVIGRLPSGLLISRHSYFMTPFSSRGRHHCKRFRDSAIPTPIVTREINAFSGGGVSSGGMGWSWDFCCFYSEMESFAGVGVCFAVIVVNLFEVINFRDCEMNQLLLIISNKYW